MDKIKSANNYTTSEEQAKRRICYSGKPLVVGLIFECDDQDEVYKTRLKSAIIYQIQQKLKRPDIKVEFAEGKINAKYFRRIDSGHYDAKAWARAEQELSCVLRYLQSRNANHIFVASEALAKYQPTIELLDILPRESPDYTNELNSFAADLYARDINPLDKVSGERKCANNCISLGLIGKESTVALLSNREEKLSSYSEVRREYAGVFLRWCVMPSHIREDFYDRLNRQCTDDKIKAHRRWLVDTLARLPRTYAQRKTKSRDISPAKIYGLVIADTKTEMMLLGLTKKQYCEAASQPGEIRRRLHNIPRHTDTWPMREVGEGKVEIYGAIDVYAKSIADIICQQAPKAVTKKPARQIIRYHEIDSYGRMVQAF